LGFEKRRGRRKSPGVPTSKHVGGGSGKTTEDAILFEGGPAKQEKFWGCPRVIGIQAIKGVASLLWPLGFLKIVMARWRGIYGGGQAGQGLRRWKRSGAHARRETHTGNEGKTFSLGMGNENFWICESQGGKCISVNEGIGV